MIVTEGLIVDREPGSRQHHPALSLAVIEGMKRKGLSQSDIARMFGVTRQAVSYYVRKYGGELTPRQKALEHWPWMVPVRLGSQAVVQRLRDHGEYMATGGKGMDYLKLQRLLGFYQRLEGLVVEFDPELPPGDAGSLGGFAYRERLESDGDLLIRVNEHTFLSEEGLKIWVRPKVLPDPLMNRKA
jgi:transposase-like protein